MPEITISIKALVLALISLLIAAFTRSSLIKTLMIDTGILLIVHSVYNVYMTFYDKIVNKMIELLKFFIGVVLITIALM